MFIDTNVFVLARFATAPGHAAARSSLKAAFDGTDPLRISRQVIREYLAVVTREQSWQRPIATVDALEDVARLGSACDILEDGPKVMDALADLCREVPVAGRQIHDANIVATMVAHGERHLLTFNRKDFLRYGARIDLVSAKAA